MDAQVSKRLSRRDVVTGIGVAAVAGLADCGGSGEGSPTETDDSGMDETNTDDGISGTDSFSYTSADGDDAVGRSLTGTTFDYPDGSGGVSDAEVASATLGGTSVADDPNSSSTSNNGDTPTSSVNAVSAPIKLTASWKLSGCARTPPRGPCCWPPRWRTTALRRTSATVSSPGR